MSLRDAFGELRLRIGRPKARRDFVVVTAAYNAGAFIERHLNSVRAQRYDPSRVTHVIVDDASTDGTSESVERWRERRDLIIGSTFLPMKRTSAVVRI